MKSSTQNNFKPIGIFLSITFALSAIFYFLMIYSGNSSGVGQYLMGIMWCPGISALITMKILKRNISDLGWKWGETKYQVRSYFLPILYGLIAYLIIWSFGWGKFYNEEMVSRITKSLGLGDIGDGFSILLYILLVGVFATISGMANALGEEIGWRGFLVPELYKTQGFTKTSLIVALIWGIWHVPGILFADYNSGTPAWFAVPCFVVLTIGGSFIFTWFRMKSGSLWTAVILHGTHNTFIKHIFTDLTEDTGNTAYYIEEFGIVLPIVVMGFAIYYWTKRNELEPAPNNM